MLQPALPSPESVSPSLSPSPAPDVVQPPLPLPPPPAVEPPALPPPPGLVIGVDLESEDDLESEPQEPARVGPRMEVNWAQPD